MAISGVGNGSATPGTGMEDLSGASALVETQIEEVMDDLVVVRRKKRRHAIWAIVGLSPAAVIPAVGLLMEGSVGLFLILCLLVIGAQIIGWARCTKREGELEETLRLLREKV